MNSKWMKRTIHEIGLLHNLHDHSVEMIVSSQFETVRNEMRSADLKKGWAPRIRMIKFATFFIKKGRLKHLEKKNYYEDYKRRKREEKYKNQQQCSSTRTEK